MLPMHIEWSAIIPPWLLTYFDPQQALISISCASKNSRLKPEGKAETVQKQHGSDQMNTIDATMAGKFHTTHHKPKSFDSLYI